MAASSSASLTKTSNRDEVEALLSDLDNLNPAKDASTTGADGGSSSNNNKQAAAAKTDDAQSLLDDLDDLVKRRAPTPKKPSARSSASGSLTRKESTTPAVAAAASTSKLVGTGEGKESDERPETTVALEEPQSSLPRTVETEAAGQQSWGNWWSSATKLADQARAELEKRAAQVQSQVVDSTGEGGSGKSTAPWTIAQNVNSFLKNNRDLNKLRSDFSKAGIKGWNELLNVVVPPIEKHEILSITLSHDMVGFDGIGDVVFSVLQKVMEAHAASSHNSEQQLIVNKAHERTSLGDERQSEGAEGERNMKAVTGFEQGWKLAEAKLSQLIESSDEGEEKERKAGGGVSLPITTCPLYIRIQPVLDSMPGIAASLPHSNPTHLFLQVLLRDPSNSLTHKTLSQPISKAFIDLNFEEHGWVEELLSESLQAALGSIGLEYIQGRNLGTSLRSDVVEAAAAQEDATA